MTAVLAEEPWDYDPKVVPLPWRASEEDAIKKRLKSGLSIGYYHSDGNVSCVITILCHIFAISTNEKLGPSPPAGP